MNSLYEQGFHLPDFSFAKLVLSSNFLILSSTTDNTVFWILSMKPDKLFSIAFPSSSAITSLICSVTLGTASSLPLSVIFKLKCLHQALNISSIAYGLFTSVYSSS
ncbi:hypothetical protein HanIR_Chr04g0194321 [Helianthus annuus]|nr:hypothetical protein HanIR_Chr04g0194321 [Helianthus annuus]